MTSRGAGPDSGLIRFQRLLGHPTARPSGAALIAALAADLNGAVVLLGANGAVLIRAGSAAGAEVAHAAASGAGGGQLGHEIQFQGWHVRVWPLAASGTPTLVAVRRQPWSLQNEAEALRAATIIATTLIADENSAERTRLAAGRRAICRSVFQLLMIGQVAEAQRVANALHPRILDAELVRVHVIAGRIRDRDSLLEACELRLDTLAIPIACPARSGHVIVIEPLTGSKPSTGRQARVSEALSELVAQSTSRSLGSSRQHPIVATATGYAQAIGALATAAVLPNRTANAEQSRSLAELVPATAVDWAVGLLQPLADVDHDGTLRYTLEMALTFTRSEAASILGVHRNTVHARLATASSALNVDLARLPHRSAFHLALCAPSGDVARGGNTTLAEVLQDEQLRAWAVCLLEQLDAAVIPRGRARMRDLLRAFAHTNGSITAAAHRIGLSPNSASRWLVAAEAAGGMRLRHGFGGAHEIAIALAATEGFELLPAG
ncbi:hypothetical protein ABH935_006451 [Catenulispora sp. GAS73]|uniref:helix-turn-helix domain-containing protein n=1 Tax=Catenulispora sp. GAS73 TaxID=3156269 RepID=UPI00351255CA